MINRCNRYHLKNEEMNVRKSALIQKKNIKIKIIQRAERTSKTLIHIDDMRLDSYTLFGRMTFS